MRLSDADLDRLLAEDVPHGDLTTWALDISARPGNMTFAARDTMVVACSEDAARLIERAGGRIGTVVASGTRLDSGHPILTASGPAGALLAAWKVAQTLVEVTSGIASSAAAIVAAARAVNPAVTVACTRKTFPGTRAAAIKAIMAGGAIPHRLGLSETVLVFPEHRAFLADAPLDQTLAGLKSRCPEKKIVVEVTDAEQALAAAQAGADVIQLEKFAPDHVAALVQALGDLPVVVAAAGGVSATNAADYARAGARVLVSSAPYWAKPRDVKVTITAA